jgi:hypothetical protein
MAANQGWFADWWQSGQFPPAWFAPADETHLTPPERARNYSVTGGITSLSPRRKSGFKRPEAPPTLAPRSVEDDEALLLFCL